MTRKKMRMKRKKEAVRSDEMGERMGFHKGKREGRKKKFVSSRNGQKAFEGK